MHGTTYLGCQKRCVVARINPSFLWLRLRKATNKPIFRVLNVFLVRERPELSSIGMYSS